VSRGRFKARSRCAAIGSSARVSFLENLQIARRRTRLAIETPADQERLLALTQHDIAWFDGSLNPSMFVSISRRTAHHDEAAEQRLKSSVAPS
jgi:hypothetical protein